MVGGSVTQALEAVKQMPDEVKEQYYTQVAAKAAISGLSRPLSPARTATLSAPKAKPATAA